MQIDTLNKELERHQREKETLEARAAKAEKKIGELNAKLENVRLLFGRILQFLNSDLFDVLRAWSLAVISYIC